MPFERVEVAERGRAEDRRSEPDVISIEDRVVVLVPRATTRGESVNELAERREPEPAGEVVVERRDRLPEQDRVVPQPRVGGDQTPPDHLEIEPRPVPARSREPPGLAGWGESLPDMSDAHARESMAQNGLNIIRYRMTRNPPPPMRARVFGRSASSIAAT